MNSQDGAPEGQNDSFQYGGQAVIEGVMMRGRDCMAVAVRRPDAGVVVHREPAASPADRPAVLRWPFIRGSVALYDSLRLGLSALVFSANEAAAEEEEELTDAEVALSMAIAFAFAIGVFILLPTVLLHFLRGQLSSSIGLNLIEGGVRLLLVLGYIVAIARLPDIKRVFEYHGAEHKVIHAYEAGAELTPAAASSFSPLHPRCGTSFLLLVAVISVFLYSFFGWPGILQRIVVRLLLLPVVAGAAYEVIKLASCSENWFVKLVTLPGLMLQRLTTGEPDEAQLRVAICALEAVLDTEELDTAELHHY